MKEEKHRVTKGIGKQTESHTICLSVCLSGLVCLASLMGLSLGILFNSAFPRSYGGNCRFSQKPLQIDVFSRSYAANGRISQSYATNWTMCDIFRELQWKLYFFSKLRCKLLVFRKATGQIAIFLQATLHTIVFRSASGRTAG